MIWKSFIFETLTIFMWLGRIVLREHCGNFLHHRRRFSLLHGSKRSGQVPRQLGRWLPFRGNCDYGRPTLGMRPPRRALLHQHSPWFVFVPMVLRSHVAYLGPLRLLRGGHGMGVCTPQQEGQREGDATIRSFRGGAAITRAKSWRSVISITCIYLIIIYDSCQRFIKRRKIDSTTNFYNLYDSIIHALHWFHSNINIEYYTIIIINFRYKNLQDFLASIISWGVL